MWWPIWLGMLRGPCYIPHLLKPRQTPSGLLAFRAEFFPRILLCMKNFIVESGDFITTSGIYRMNDHPGREITLIYGDAVPTFQGRKIKFRLIRAAKNPRRG